MTPRTWVWTVLMLLLAAPLALADEDEDEDEKEKSDDRKLEISVDDDEATIKLERETGDLEDSVKIGYDARKAKLVVKHEEETADNETEQKLEARFLALVEFVDEDADGAYDAGEPIASAWALSDDGKDAKVPTNGTVDWGPIAVTDTTSGNSTGKKLSSRASFAENATFGLDLFVYGDFTLVGDASLEPTEAKIDIIIQHYPYVRDDSALAVLVDLKAKEEFEDDRESDDEDGIASEASSGNLTFRLTFTWLDHAAVDGVDRPVRSTVIKEKQESEPGEIEQKARVALAYARGDLIVHDPSMGVAYGTASAGTSMATPFAAPLALVAVVAIGALARRRQ